MSHQLLFGAWLRSQHWAVKHLSVSPSFSTCGDLLLFSSLCLVFLAANTSISLSLGEGMSDTILKVLGRGIRVNIEVNQVCQIWPHHLTQYLAVLGYVCLTLSFTYNRTIRDIPCLLHLFLTPTHHRHYSRQRTGQLRGGVTSDLRSRRLEFEPTRSLYSLALVRFPSYTQVEHYSAYYNSNPFTCRILDIQSVPDFSTSQPEFLVVSGSHVQTLPDCM
ncbi:hypothetical protein RRG08_006394 [Elysia crispata]|uniref:Uncharacterized protein n=1 Tax=Elysia crispata TaxID=231223 RepID=A0AAE1CRI7_9GAST|nr:hypothetical protein RRG08_006394 [Elysia crispata]